MTTLKRKVKIMFKRFLHNFVSKRGYVQSVHIKTVKQLAFSEGFNKGKEAPRKNRYNICEHCYENPNQLSYLVADTGECSICGEHGVECWDVDLINMYYEFGLPDELIHRDLPRLRIAFPDRHNNEEYSLASIAKLVTQFTLKRAEKRTSLDKAVSEEK